MIPIGAFVVALLLGFGAAKVQSEKHMEAQRAACDEAVNAATAEQVSEQDAHGKTQAKLAVLKGYRLLHLAIFSLEERNFGTAEKHAKQAAKVLAGVNVEEIQERIAPVSKSLSSFKLEVSDNVGAQRKALLELSEQLDRVIAAF